jgi:GTP-binding protein
VIKPGGRRRGRCAIADGWAMLPGMHFVDEAHITVRAGSGGAGAVHFRREKHVPQGGPDGGDGGKGGDVIVVADGRSRTLYDYHLHRLHAAESGRKGQGNRRTGRSGVDLVLPVPPGTQVRDEATGELLADLVHQGERAIVAGGGNGGFGNARFATAVRRAPDFANPGQVGAERALALELKLLADVALVGWPNVGKSSLINAISACKAKVADYPFTTLQPNLGVVRHSGRTFTVADIPGLIEGAAAGAGLGLRFLRHIERCAVTVFLVSPVDGPPPRAALAVLRRELGKYSAELASRPNLVALAKCDVIGPDAEAEATALARALGEPVHAVSAATRTGLDALLTALLPHLQAPGPAPTHWSPHEA